MKVSHKLSSPLQMLAALSLFVFDSSGDSENYKPSADVNNVNHILLLLLREVSQGQRKKQKKKEERERKPQVGVGPIWMDGPILTCISSVVVRQSFDSHPVSVFSAKKLLCQ